MVNGYEVTYVGKFDPRRALQGYAYDPNKQVGTREWINQSNQSLIEQATGAITEAVKLPTQIVEKYVVPEVKTAGTVIQEGTKAVGAAIEKTYGAEGEAWPKLESTIQKVDTTVSSFTQPVITYVQEKTPAPIKEVVMQTAETVSEAWKASLNAATKAKEEELAKGNIIKANIAAAGEAVLGLGAVVPLASKLVTAPLSTTKEFTIGTIESTKKQLETPKTLPGAIGGIFAGGAIGGYGVGSIKKGIKSTYIKLGAEVLPTESVFAKSVLKGEKFPLAKGTQETLQLVEKTRGPTGTVYGQTSTTFTPKRSDISQAGGRAKSGLEDPGIYMTAKGEGSPAFLGITPQAGKISKINIAKDLWSDVSSVFKKKEAPTTPNVLIIELKGVKKLPREVVAKPGFKPVEEFFKKAEDGYGYITKRSELGQGEIVAKKYYNEAFVNQKTGKVQPKLMKESGTTESEFVLPANKPIVSISQPNFISKIKGYSKVVKYEGEYVPIREYTAITKPSNLVPSSSSVSNVIKNLNPSGKSYTISEYVKYMKTPQFSRYGLIPKVSGSSVSSKIKYESEYPTSQTYSDISGISEKSSTTSISDTSSITSSTVSKTSSSLPSVSSYSEYIPSRPSYKPSVSPSSYKPQYSRSSYKPSVSPSSYKPQYSSPKYTPSYPTSYPRISDLSKYKIPLSRAKPIKGFDVYVKRYGKTQALGVSLTQKQAALLAQKRLKMGLGATAFIRPSGRTAKKSNIQFRARPGEFRQYKISKGKKIFDPRLFIQEKGFRLGTKSEVSEIQAAKRVTVTPFMQRQMPMGYTGPIVPARVGRAPKYKGPRIKKQKRTARIIW
jgi:hypothetical protein